MTEEPLQGQDAFLNAARTAATRVSVFLVNGIRLVGCVESFDQHTVLLRSATGVQLVYKHAISTVQPDTERARPVRNADSLRELSPLQCGGRQNSNHMGWAIGRAPHSSAPRGISLNFHHAT